MSFISSLFGKLLTILYHTTNQYGIAIILFTIITKIILMPLTVMQLKSTASMKKVQPLQAKIQEKYKGDPQKQSEYMQDLYRRYNINPLMGCLPVMIQLPIIFALFAVMKNPVQYVFGTEAAYKAANISFIWIKSLADPDIIKIGKISVPFILPALTAFFQYVSSKKMMADQNNSPQAASMQKSMMISMPIMMLFFGISSPSGLMLYWAVSALLSIVQSALIPKIMPEDKEVEDKFEHDLEAIEKEVEEKQKARKKLKRSKKNDDFYNEYRPTGKEKELKRVRKIKKSSILSDESE